VCGICGIFRPDGAPVEADRVVRMRDAMTPRGPDGFGLASGPGYALGHRRLSIIDLSAD
jgi:asparagine synthase (glutamine-hydrolysing)